VQYGISGELLRISYGAYYNQYTETRTYNSRLQLTSVGTMQYTYSPNHNNGQITQQLDSVSGEQVTYTYDSLQRLISAVTTDSSWGQSFTYDGFGNRTSAVATKGSAPYGNWSYDSNNHMLNYGWDANGNMTSSPGGAMTYDVENRVTSAGGDQYAYAPGNKRIWKKMPNGTEELYFYSISGQKLGTYRPFIYQYGISISTVDTNLYFGSRTIVSRGVTVVPDRLGSNRAGGSRYFPYGEEQQVTPGDRDKFGTYYRDSTTGLDYAQNRYYASTLGRFMTPDPYKSGSGSGTPANPQSWNRYAYVQNDPINFRYPSGLFLAPATGDEDPVGLSCIINGTPVYDPLICYMYNMPPVPNPIDPNGADLLTTRYYVPGTSITITNVAGARTVNNAITYLKDALADDDDCTKWLNQSSKAPTPAMLTSFLNDERSRSGSADISDAGVAALSNTGSYVPGWDLLVNNTWGFYNFSGSAGFVSSYSQITNIQFNTDKFREFTLLHEFTHLLGVPGFAPNDASTNLQRANNDLLWQNCKKTIQSF
jgi:RHS repeat-associated protein